MERNERSKQGIVTGIIGLVCNLLLGGGKLVCGILTGSVSILSDAANNLSDAGSNVLTVTSFALGNRAADKNHPFGHGRYEYIAGLLIGVIILVVGVELIVSSVEKIVAPVAVTYSMTATVLLGVSIAVKLGMGVFYSVRAKRLGSATLRAAAFDSFSDCAVTAGLLIAVIASRYCPYPLDGPAGLVISVIIVAGGVKLVLDTVNSLLGRGGDADTNRKIREIVTGDPAVVGMHDLHVHDYGPSCKLASVHAEFDRDMSITDAHGIIDRMERKAEEELGIELVIHVDPIDDRDVLLGRLRNAVGDVTRLYAGVGAHDVEIDHNAHVVRMHVTLPDRKKDDRLRELLEGAVAGALGEGYALELTEDVCEISDKPDGQH